VEVLWPHQCQQCGGQQLQPTDAGQPGLRHQVTEIPPIQPCITEYQCPEVVCGSCGKTSYASLPQPVRGHFGPQLTALIAYWTVVCRMPRRVVEATPLVPVRVRPWRGPPREEPLVLGVDALLEDFEVPLHSPYFRVSPFLGSLPNCSTRPCSGFLCSLPGSPPAILVPSNSHARMISGRAGSSMRLSPTSMIAATQPSSWDDSDVLE
jgi:hypothetical protein